MLGNRPLHLVLQLFSCQSISKHILLVPPYHLLLGHLPLDVRHDHLLVVLTHHLVPVMFELVISIAEPFLLNKLSLSVLSHESPVLILLHCFHLLLQVSCLVIHGTRHSVMISDQVPLGLLHLPYQVRIRLSFPVELTIQVSILVK